MKSVTLKRFTSFDYGLGLGYLEVWVNPAQIAYVEPRRRRSSDEKDVLDGSMLYFQQEGGVLAVKEPVGQVVALLQSGNGGMCRDCYQLLAEAWRTLCDDCRQHRHYGVDEDYEAARADLLP